MKAQVREVICDVFRLDPGIDDASLTSEYIADWDSVTHLTLILALESRFGVSFEPEQASELDNLDSIVAAVERLQASDGSD